MTSLRSGPATSSNLAPCAFRMNVPSKGLPSLIAVTAALGDSEADVLVFRMSEPVVNHGRVRLSGATTDGVYKLTLNGIGKGEMDYGSIHAQV